MHDSARRIESRPGDSPLRAEVGSSIRRPPNHLARAETGLARTSVRVDQEMVERKSVEPLPPGSGFELVRPHAGRVIVRPLAYQAPAMQRPPAHERASQRRRIG